MLKLRQIRLHDTHKSPDLRSIILTCLFVDFAVPHFVHLIPLAKRSLAQGNNVSLSYGVAFPLDRPLSLDAQCQIMAYASNSYSDF